MTCSEIQQVLVELVFGELEPVKEARANEHLLGCSTCRAEEWRLLDLRDAARGHGIDPSAELQARIEASLPRRARTARGLGHPVPAYVALAAAAVGAVAVALLPVRGTPRVERVPEIERSAGIEIRDGRLPFVVADSYDTRVARAAPTDSAPVRPRLQDSL